MVQTNTSCHTKKCPHPCVSCSTKWLETSTHLWLLERSALVRQWQNASGLQQLIDIHGLDDNDVVVVPESLFCHHLRSFCGFIGFQCGWFSPQQCAILAELDKFFNALHDHTACSFYTNLQFEDLRNYSEPFSDVAILLVVEGIEMQKERLEYLTSLGKLLITSGGKSTAEKNDLVDQVTALLSNVSNRNITPAVIDGPCPWCPTWSDTTLSVECRSCQLSLPISSSN